MPDFLATADPSWYPRVLRTLARDYPKISDKVWDTAITENAAENTADRAAAPPAPGSTEPEETTGA